MIVCLVRWVCDKLCRNVSVSVSRCVYVCLCHVSFVCVCASKDRHHNDVRADQLGLLANLFGQAPRSVRL